MATHKKPALNEQQVDKLVNVIIPKAIYDQGKKAIPSLSLKGKDITEVENNLFDLRRANIHRREKDPNAQKLVAGIKNVLAYETLQRTIVKMTEEDVTVNAENLIKRLEHDQTKIKTAYYNTKAKIAKMQRGEIGPDYTRYGYKNTSQMLQQEIDISKKNLVYLNNKHDLYDAIIHAAQNKKQDFDKTATAEMAPPKVATPASNPPKTNVSSSSASTEELTRRLTQTKLNLGKLSVTEPPSSKVSTPQANAALAAEPKTFDRAHTKSTALTEKPQAAVQSEEAIPPPPPEPESESEEGVPPPPPEAESEEDVPPPPPDPDDSSTKKSTFKP